MLALGGVRQAKVHAQGLLIIIWPQTESVVAQVFAGLDVVVVLVGPVESDLLALVGDGVDARLVNALGEEVALGVVAAEEAIEMVVGLAFQRADVHGVALKLGAQILDLGRVVRVHSRRLDARNHLGQFILQLRLVGGLVLAECRPHLRQEVLVEELRHLGALGVHDAVEAEVQVRLVELEQLLQQGLQLFVLLAHKGGYANIILTLTIIPDHSSRPRPTPERPAPSWVFAELTCLSGTIRSANLPS